MSGTMVDKWADYLISAVRYNVSETHIQAVHIHTDNGSRLALRMRRPEPTW
jgi:hypothetical protein